MRHFRSSTARTIAKLRAAGYLPPAQPKAIRESKGATETHCWRGHPREAWNIYTYPDGRRECAACRKLNTPLKVPKHWAEWGLSNG